MKHKTPQTKKVNLNKNPREKERERERLGYQLFGLDCGGENQLVEIRAWHFP